MELISPKQFVKHLFWSVVVGATLAGTAFFAADRLLQSVNWTIHTHLVIEKLQTVLTRVVDAETGTRGYLLTQDVTYLEPYHETLEKLNRDLMQLKALCKDNESQTQRLRTLEELIQQRLERMAVSIDLRRQRSLGAVLERARSGIGHQQMERIRDFIEQLQNEEQKLLRERLEKRRAYVRFLIGVLGLFGMVVFALWLSFLHQMRQKQKSQAQLTKTSSQLERTEARYRMLVEGVKDYAIYMLDPNGKIATWTPAATRIKGYTEDEVIGSYFGRFYTPEDISVGRPQEILKKAAETGHSTFEGWQLKKDGTPFWSSVLITALKNEGGQLQGFSKIIRDGTDQKKAEEALKIKEHELHQSRKMEAVGRLAGGVAHDFNNLMTGIIGITEDILRDGHAPHRQEDLQEVIRAAQRASHLTKQLLAFSRRQVVAPVVLNLNTVLTEMQKMLGRLIGEDIELKTLLDSNLGNVRADPGQIEQVLINLVVNSRDAMPNGGRITIETSNVELGEEYTKRHFEVQPGLYVLLAVSDTGGGIPPEIQNNIFEPFFTTKTKDKGTGLGLATVYGIVKQNGGDIFLYSHPGEGTVFKIYLPRIFENEKIERRKEDRLVLPTGAETILLVEDEDIVRKVAARTLARQGYKILEAKNGKDALEVSSVYNDTIHLLLTDVVMPGMNGRQLAEMMVVSRPEVKVLYMSGYTENLIVTRGILKSGISFLEKSFTPESLCTKVRAVLDAPQNDNLG